MNTKQRAILNSIVFSAVSSVAFFLNSTSALAGGPISISRSEVLGAPYEAYLDCSCMNGSYTVQFHNTDSMPLSLSINNSQIGPINPGTFSTYTLNDPGTYQFSVVEAPAQKGQITILNSAPKFPAGGKLTVLSIGYTQVDLQWPELDDDGTGVRYKLFQNGVLINDTEAIGLPVTNLNEGTSYSSRLESYDAAGLKASTTLSASTTTKKNPVSATPASASTSSPTKNTAQTPASSATPLPESANSPDSEVVTTQATADSSEANGSGATVDSSVSNTEATFAKQKWMAISVLGLIVLAGAGLLFWRGRIGRK